MEDLIINVHVAFSSYGLHSPDHVWERGLVLKHGQRFSHLYVTAASAPSSIMHELVAIVQCKNERRDPSCPSSTISSSSLWPLSHIEAKTVRFCCEGYLASFGEVEDIPCHSMHCLPSLVGDIELALHDDLHFVIIVSVDQRRALLKAIEAGRNGFCRV